MQNWYVYLVRCHDDSFYCGITTNLERRIKEHNGLLKNGAKYTRSRRPVELCAYATCVNRQNATRLETKVKNTARAKKISILQNYLEEELMNNLSIYNDIDTWLKTWEHDPINAKQAFIYFYDRLKNYPDLTLEFKQRAGVSYSLRAKHPVQTKHELFVMIDVVDDDERWLSVCFYAHMVNDPQELGDFVPQGLLGEDALCLNLEEDDETIREYILRRIEEAASFAKSGN